MKQKKSKTMIITFDPEVPYSYLFEDIFDEILDVLDKQGLHDKYVATLSEDSDERGLFDEVD